MSIDFVYIVSLYLIYHLVLILTVFIDILKENTRLKVYKTDINNLVTETIILEPSYVLCNILNTFSLLKIFQSKKLSLRGGWSSLPNCIR